MAILTQPLGRPRSLLTLYRRHTKDFDAVKEFVKIAMESDQPRRCLMVSLKLRGYTDQQIGDAMGISADGVRQAVQRAMKRVWKIVNAAPRFHIKGHQGNKKDLKQYQPKKAA